MMKPGFVVNYAGAIFPFGASPLAMPSQIWFALSLACQGEVFQTGRGLKNEDWWRRRESNPRPKAFHSSIYVRSLSFYFSPDLSHPGRVKSG